VYVLSVLFVVLGALILVFGNIAVGGGMLLLGLWFAQLAHMEAVVKRLNELIYLVGLLAPKGGVNPHETKARPEDK